MRTHLQLPVMAVLLSAACTAAFANGVGSRDPLDNYNVVWDTPSKDSSGSMPIGNGDIGLNLWVEEDGDLLFYISKTDSWDEYARLLKLGRIRVRLTPNPFQKGLHFKQELRLRQGEILINAGQVSLRIWVDANRPVIRLEAEGKQPFRMEAALEVWRTQKRDLSPDEAFGVEGFSKDEPPAVYPDTVLEGQKDRVVWYHRNQASMWRVALAHQGLGSLLASESDPLLNRTCGAAMKCDGLVKENATAHRSVGPAKRFALAIYPLTAQTDTAQEWLRQLDKTIADVDAVPLEKARAEHQAWWNEFWNRSWVRVTGSKAPATVAAKIASNKLPLRIGADSGGGNQFLGDIARVSIYNRALTAEEIGRPPSAETPAGCVADWDFSGLLDGAFTSAAPGALKAKVVGDVRVVEGPGGPGTSAVRLSGNGFLEVAHCEALDLEDAVTMEAWVKPGRLPAGGGRIIDKVPVGTAEGYMLDTYPGNSLRLIVSEGTLSYDAKLPPGRWSRVAAVFDARTGEQKLYLNGVLVAVPAPKPPSPPEHEIVSRGYALQRFINACGGRGAFPIKFNGSIFTVDVIGKYDADYRAWGGCYWFQNTRLPYWPMAASGDSDFMLPLFRMYRSALPLAQARTRIYFSHEGAFFPETMYFWGTYMNSNFGYGWEREGKPVWLPDNPYIRHYQSGGLELTALMLDYYAYTQDRDFVQSTLLPLGSAIVEFYDKHYPRDPDGKVRFEPAQALETWWQCVNPMPEVAGLRFVLDGLLALPTDLVPAASRADWARFREELPATPLRQVDKQTLLAPADKYDVQGNVENPELYAIFPYRAYGVGKPALDTARRTFTARQFRGNWGWQQDDIQAAFLGRADEARRFVSGRFANKHAGSRFPAFWGPNFDWIPDQDHGCVGLMALQTMLLQAEGRNIILFPAWPKDWDVEFRLHAPYNTTVEGIYRNGKLEHLKVTPESRAKDVVRMRPQ